MCSRCLRNASTYKGRWEAAAREAPEVWDQLAWATELKYTISNKVESIWTCDCHMGSVAWAITHKCVHSWTHKEKNKANNFQWHEAEGTNLQCLSGNIRLSSLWEIMIWSPDDIRVRWSIPPESQSSRSHVSDTWNIWFCLWPFKPSPQLYLFTLGHKLDIWTIQGRILVTVQVVLERSCILIPGFAGRQISAREYLGTFWQFSNQIIDSSKTTKGLLP